MRLFHNHSPKKEISAQKCGGVQIKIIKNNTIGKIVNLGLLLKPISGGKAPAAPPITIF